MEEVAELGGDPADPVWLWLLKRGPHGPSFSWGQTRRQPPGYVGVEHLQEIVEEQTDIDPSFVSRAKKVVAMALTSESPEVLRRAIQVAAVLGGEKELKAISGMVKHTDASVAADARASAFHLKKRLKSTTR
jgi:hypothetical protein